MRICPSTKVIFVIAVVASVILFRNSSVLAQGPTPTKKAPAPAVTPRAPAGGQFSVFLPFVKANAPKIAPKKGIALTYGDCPSATAVGAIWEHGWSPNPAACTGIENIPMIWGATDVNATLGGNSQWILGFNEPDSSSQSNLTPSQAASLWRQIEQKYPSRKLVSPAPSSANPNWLVSFHDAYVAAYGTPPRLDALAVHCYVWPVSACITQTQMFETWATSWGTPEVWVTEFSFQTSAPRSQAQAIQDGQTYINWMESNDPMVTRFAWFASKIQGTEWWAIPDFYTPLVDWNTGQLTAFGTMYLPFP